MGPPHSAAAAAAAAGMFNPDPFRDPYRALSMYAAAAAQQSKMDPLREARERELMRMNPLGSMIMNEQDRARLSALGYPAPPPTPGGGLFPPPTSLGMLGAGAGFPPGAAKPPGHLGLYPPHPPSAVGGFNPGMPGLGVPPRLTPPLTPTVNGHNSSPATTK